MWMENGTTQDGRGGVVLRNCNWRGRAVEWLGCESETTRQCPRGHPSEFHPHDDGRSVGGWVAFDM